MKKHQAARDLHRNSFLPELYAVPDRDTSTGGFEVEESGINMRMTNESKYLRPIRAIRTITSTKPPLDLSITTLILWHDLQARRRTLK